MKQIIFIVAAFLISAITAFAQVYKVHVEWEQNECSCLNQGNSNYAVKVVIYDEANDMVVVEGTEVQVDFGIYTADVSVSEVNDHCANQNLPNIPAYKVWVGVAVFCDSYNPPESICNTNDYLFSPNQSCTDFDNDNVITPKLYFN